MAGTGRLARPAITSGGRQINDAGDAGMVATIRRRRSNSHAASPFPVLTRVYYLQSNVTRESKAVANILVKRGKEWHGPDRMVINEKSIVFAEPAGPDSRSRPTYQRI
jgi:hypothetical protein